MANSGKNTKLKGCWNCEPVRGFHLGEGCWNCEKPAGGFHLGEGCWNCEKPAGGFQWQM